MSIYVLYVNGTFGLFIFASNIGQKLTRHSFWTEIVLCRKPIADFQKNLCLSTKITKTFFGIRKDISV